MVIRADSFLLCNEPEEQRAMFILIFVEEGDLNVLKLRDRFELRRGFMGGVTVEHKVFKEASRVLFDDCCSSIRICFKESC